MLSRAPNLVLGLLLIGCSNLVVIAFFGCRSHGVQIAIKNILGINALLHLLVDIGGMREVYLGVLHEKRQTRAA